jgi:hypothetical protein
LIFLENTYNLKGKIMKKIGSYLLICFFAFFVVATTWSSTRADTRSSYVAEESDSEDTDADTKSKETEEESKDSEAAEEESRSWMDEEDGSAEEEKADTDDSWRYDEADTDDAGSEEGESYRFQF